jgi:glycosyltransferase involved in cell wall biosynthesis
MKVCIIIPVFNEQDFIKNSVESLINQTIKPAEVIYVNDNSTDNSKNIIKNLTGKCEWIRIIDHKSVQEHIPGGKVIEAFNFGLKNLETQFICKFDGDIILPTNYIEKIIEIFNKKEKVGITGGNLYILKNRKWIYENIAAKTHVRGPIKAYRAECFNDIKGLKSSIGWDTVDVLLAQKKGWLIYTDRNLIVKHLKPTGQKYSLKSKILQGESLYKMRFGFILSVLSLLKSSFNNYSISRLFFGFVGYIISFLKQKPFIVTKEEGVFIRDFRWRVIYDKYLKF